MIYVYRVRLLVQIVKEEMARPTDPMDERGGNPSVLYCLHLFRQKNKKYTDSLGRQILAIATGQGYLGIDNSDGSAASQQRLQMKQEGLILLTPSGYINALARAIKDALSLVSIAIAVAALIVSIIALNHK